MAKLEAKGIDGFTAYLKKTQQLTGQMAHDMLDAAAVVLAGTWKTIIRRRKHVDTEAMVQSVKATKTTDKNGYLEKSVYPQGKDKKGVRNAEKAFLLHYGWGDKTGDHFVDEIGTEAEPEVVAAMENVMNNYIERGGK